MTHSIKRGGAVAPAPSSGIKTWAKDDRPREKLLYKGVQALSDAELLAILLRTGHTDGSALDLAKNLLARVSHNLQELGRLDVQDLMQMRGIGQAKAITVVAAVELGRRRQAGNPLEKPLIRHSKDAANLLKTLLADHPHEVFAVLFLNRSNRVVHYKITSSGGITGTIVDPRLILRMALEHHAVSFIVCHNHPSGQLEPSRADKDLTRRLREAGALLEIRLVDHIIVSSAGYFSFADQGWP